MSGGSDIGMLRGNSQQKEADRNLVVVRCGDQSLHPNWCEGPRNFDIAISYYGSDQNKHFPEATIVHKLKAGKWDGLADFFRENKGVIDKYDRFWFPDDDILTTSTKIDHMFQLSRKYNLELCQPTLTHDSYFGHPNTLNNPKLKIRYMSFVEIMVPVMTRDFLIKALPTFDNTRTGFGLDYVWAQMIEDPSQIAFLDEIMVRHTRPVGGELHSKRPVGSLDTITELRQNISARGITGRCRIGDVRVPCLYPKYAITRNGRRIGSIMTGLMQAFGHIDIRANTVQLLSYRRILAQFAKVILK